MSIEHIAMVGRYVCVRACVVFPKHSSSLPAHYVEIGDVFCFEWKQPTQNLCTWRQIAYSSSLKTHAHTFKYLTSICIYFHVFGHRMGWPLVKSNVLRCFWLSSFPLLSSSSYIWLFPEHLQLHYVWTAISTLEISTRRNKNSFSFVSNVVRTSGEYK